jgi:hypothetical protein
MVKATRQTKAKTRPGATTGVPEEPWGGYWENASAEELARRQGVKPLRSGKDLAIPELKGENIDELLAILREIRGK